MASVVTVEGGNMRGREVVFSHDSTEWETPPELFAEWDKEFHFTVDVAATVDNTKCRSWITKNQDALRCTWKGRVWCNPPYDRYHIHEWIEKAWASVNSGTAEVVVMLLPARTSNKWFHKYLWPYKAEIRFIKGRIQFVGAPTGAPFPSMLVVFRSSC